MTEKRFQIRHRPEQSRYVLVDRGEDGSAEKQIGHESYLDVDDARVLYSTVVSEEYSGQGLASQLLAAVMGDVVAEDRRIVAVCPYVAAWLRKHPEHEDRIEPTRPEHLAAVEGRPE